MKVDGWTEGRYRSFITSTLRGGMRRWPPKWQVLKEAYIGKLPNSKGRLVSHYRCAACNGHFTSTNIEVDHCSPVVSPTTGFISWDDYIDKLFCSKEELQTLCKQCHKLKTASEKKVRVAAKKKPPTTSSSKRRKPAGKVARKVRASSTTSTKKPK